MAHSYVVSLYHCVWSTKNRESTIADEFRDRLWAYMGGIAKTNDMKALAVGGTNNHTHVLLSLPSTIEIAKAIQLIKGGSSKWIHEEFPAHKEFEWQEGYGAFSIGISGVESTKLYIANQEEHHRVKSFEEEFVAFLEKHRIDYDPKHVWG